MKPHDQIIREAALALHEAIVAGAKEGYLVVWPRRPSELPAIAVNQKAQPVATVAVKAVDASPETVQRATVAAQKAVDRVVERAADKA